MRGIQGLFSDISICDPNRGITFKGVSIPELKKFYPTAEHNGEPLPEGLLYLLLTSEKPTDLQVELL